MRFDGDSDFLVTTQLETTDDQTVIRVLSYSKASLNPQRRWGGQIVSYDGPPSRQLAGTLQPGVIQIGEPLREGEFQATLVIALAFPGFVGETPVETGRVDATQPLGAEHLAVIAYRYSYSQQTAQLWINGKLSTQSRAFAPVAITSRKLIGRHAWKELFFAGDLAELGIYNGSLTDAQLAQVVEFLAKRYGIAQEG